MKSPSSVAKKREAALKWLDFIRENVEKAIDIEAEFNMSYPNLHPVWNAPLPPKIGGMGLLRHIITLNLQMPQSSTEKTMEVEKK